MRISRGLALGAGCALVAGCASLAPDEDAAGGVAASFHAALSASDGAAACALLAPATASELDSCATAVLGVPPADGVRSVEAFGRGAQVRMSGDTVFLTQVDGRWMVRAAGCTPRPEQPYDCEVEGG